MKDLSKHIINTTFWLVAVLLAGSAAQAQEMNQWNDPFPAGSPLSAPGTSDLTLEAALLKVRAANPLLEIGAREELAATELVDQAGKRPNPELEFEVENFGGDMSGFSESEFTVVLSQELELFGKGKNRKTAATRDLEMIEWFSNLQRHDIYLETKLRYYDLVHAQTTLDLAVQSLELSELEVEATRARVEKGAALASELQLAELDFQQAKLHVSRAEADIAQAQIALSALWNDTDTGLLADHPGKPDPQILPAGIVDKYLANSRDIVTRRLESERLNAQINVESAAGKPNLAVSGGYRRSQGEKTNSFLMGLSIPLPLFDKNKGTVRSLRANREAADLLAQQETINSRLSYSTRAQSISIMLSERNSLENISLPKAEEAYASLKRAYEQGRLPYTSLREGNRTLIDLRAELNDLDLSIRQEIIEIERLLGVNIDKSSKQ